MFKKSIATNNMNIFAQPVGIQLAYTLSSQQKPQDANGVIVTIRLLALPSA